MSNITYSNQRSSTLPVVLPISWIDHLTHLARERGMNRSALVREALQQTSFANDKTDSVSNENE